MYDIKSKVMAVILVVVSLVAIAFLIYKYNEERAYGRMLNSTCTEVGEAKVIAATSHLKTGRRKTTATRSHMTLVTYYNSVLEMKLDNRSYTIKDDTKYPVRVGQTVTVHYSPADPSIGYVGNEPSATGSGYISLISIPGFIIIGVLVRLGKRYGNY